MRLSTFIDFHPTLSPKLKNLLTEYNIVDSCSQFITNIKHPQYKQIDSTESILKIKIRHKKPSIFNEAFNNLLFLNKDVWNKSITTSTDEINGNYIILIPNNYNYFEFHTQTSLDQLQINLTHINDNQIISESLASLLDPNASTQPNSYLFYNINHYYAIHKKVIKNYPLLMQYLSYNHN